jgi:hypothetical protein
MNTNLMEGKNDNRRSRGRGPVKKGLDPLRSSERINPSLDLI